MNTEQELHAALTIARAYVDQAVKDDGGIDNCEIGDRLAIERIDAALARRSSDEQAEVVGWAYERLTHLMIAGEDRWIKHLSETEPRPSDNIRNVRRLYASPPAVAAGGVTEEMAARALAAYRKTSSYPIVPANHGEAMLAALTAALAVGDEGIREDDLVTAVSELLRTVHQPTPKAGSDYWHVTAGKHVEFGKLITKLHSLLDFPTPPFRGEGV